MSSARRSLLTATAAATLLGALWFVPSANATSESPATSGSPARAQSATNTTNTTTTASTESTTATRARAATEMAGTAAADAVDATETQLADTGSFDTTPYVVGGTVFLSLGAGFVVYSVRRERLGF